MVSVPIYLINRALFRIKEFFRHWYINSFYIYGHFVLTQLEKIDRVLAFRITLRHIFHPLYGDRTILGYILGFVFRTGRLVVGGIVYAFIIILAVILYLVWLAIPIFIIYKSII